jgi:hypothetical protein
MVELTERKERFYEICNAVELFDHTDADEPVHIPRGLSGLTDYRLRDALLSQASQSEIFSEVLCDGLMFSLMKRHAETNGEATPTAEEAEALSLVATLTYAWGNEALAFNFLQGATMACKMAEIPIPRIAFLVLSASMNEIPPKEIRSTITEKSPIALLEQE